MQMFLDREQLAAISEEKTDNILDCVEEEVQEVDPKVIIMAEAPKLCDYGSAKMLRHWICQMR